MQKFILFVRTTGRVLAGILLFQLAFPAAARAKPIKFDIAAQPAADALIAFAKQSGADVLYSYDELKAVHGNTVSGEFEPERALELLLKDTGYKATREASGKFVVAKEPVRAGSIRGGLTWPDGAPAEGVQVFIRETGQSAPTDRYGQYVFAEVPAGTFLLIAQAEGYQPLHLTDVTVKANSELILSKQAMRKADEITKLEPYVVHAEAVTELDPYAVTSNKEKPFSTGNMDMPRTINDVQPYYIFDSQTIETSGATNVEELLKQRLTMNAVVQTYSQSYSNMLGNTSSVNLRGVGTDKTLILVDGRRQAGVSVVATDYQTDLNGISLDAIERVEVLPSSASGIYGGSAIGGVVNIITKRDYTGGEIRTTYDNSFDTDTAKRSVSLNYGLALEGGKTRLALSASWAEANMLLVQDRLDLIQTSIATIMNNSPTYVTSAYTLWRGALPNITTTSSSLVLKNGTSLNAQRTYIPAGTSASTSATALAAGLLANAGQWNLDLPSDTNTTNGLLRSLGSAPRTRSLQVSLRRQMRPWLEAYVEFAVNENKSVAVYNPGSAVVTVPATAPTNPFTTAVQVTVSDPTQTYMAMKTQSSRVSAGFLAQLPAGWNGTFDYTNSENRYYSSYSGTDSTARTADIASGVLNPFVDQSLYPLGLSKYQFLINNRTRTRIHDFILKGTGKLPALPWGQPNLTAGLEYRIEQAPEATLINDYSITEANSAYIEWYPRQATSGSVYAETLVPLVKAGWLPGVQSLDLQVSGRAERYEVDTGTTFKVTYYERSPTVTSYSGALQNGQPYFSKVRYYEDNYTVGLKYQPVKEVTLRVSWATAFLPPTMAQLAETQDPSTSTTNVSDPVTGRTTAVYTIGGGNANLQPQNSTSTNLGIIWEPTWSPLQGLRLGAEHYKIKQSDAISTLSAQQIVNLESLYPDRVTRDSTGTITMVNISSLNLYRSETEGWDLSASYTRKTSIGTFRLDAVESIITHLKNQYSLTAPAYDAVNFPAEGGSVKYKSNATLTWDWRNWTAGWTTRYYSRYKQYGAAGGPYSLQYASGGTYSYYVAAQGSDWVESQIYHDVFVGYSFGRNRLSRTIGRRSVGSFLLDGLTVQLGVRNLFDKTPPLDAYYNTSQLFMSPYGDMRLRSYWLSVKKVF